MFLPLLMAGLAFAGQSGALIMPPQEQVQYQLTAPVASVALYSNGYGFFNAATQASVQPGKATVIVQNFSRRALFDTIWVSDNAGKITYQKLVSRQKNITTSSKVPLTTFELLNSSVGKQVSITVGGAAKSGTLVWVSPDSLAISS
ncbi:hypothetical protein FJZ26_01395, partial [Candidatus Parvarchaeota archaeon]|nr:hypothetical protein [Candidatus Parvarchaeota archaeon]